MKNTPSRKQAGARFAQVATCVTLLITGLNASAGEGSKLRQSPVGAFGGEIAAPADNPGLFGTAILSYANIYNVTDANGNSISLAAKTVPLPTGTPLAARSPTARFRSACQPAPLSSIRSRPN